MEGKHNTGSGKKTRWFFFMAGLILGGGLASGFCFINMGQDKRALNSVISQADRDIAEEVAAPVYFPLEPFTVSLTSGNQSVGRVLYIGMTLKLNHEKAQESVKEFLPEIRSRLLVLFSQQTAGELLTVEGKQHLADKTKEIINQLLADKQKSEVVEVLFNAFILR